MAEHATGNEMPAQDTVPLLKTTSPNSIHVGILGIHGPEAMATLQAMLEQNIRIMAWSRRTDSPWAQRLARRGVVLQVLPGTSSQPPEIPVSSLRQLDWLLVFPGARLARGLPSPERIPADLLPCHAARIVQIVPAGLPTQKVLQAKHILTLSTGLVLERWLNAEMRRAIARGQLPFPSYRFNALPLISANRIAHVILALCNAKLTIQQVSHQLSGEWVPLPVLLKECRDRTGRHVRHRNRSTAAIAWRMGRETALMASWMRKFEAHETPAAEWDTIGLEPAIEGMRRLPW